MRNIKLFDCDVDVIFGEDGMKCVLVNGEEFGSYEEALKGIRVWVEKVLDEMNGEERNECT